MNAKYKDLTGQRFGRLTVIKRAPNVPNKSGHSSMAWECLCDCGNTTIVRACNLNGNHTSSCGCLLHERNAKLRETIKIKYLRGIGRDDEAVNVIANGDWIDLRAAEDVTLKAFEFCYIPLGVAVELPKGNEALIVPRSSTFKKYGVMMANSIGVVDESYKGDNDEWHFPAVALRDTFIPKGDRICQFRIIRHQPIITIKEVETLGNPDRGGLGSTGRA